MGYIGTPIDTRNTFQSLQGKRFNGDGSTTDFTLDVAPSNVLDIEVFVGNVRQDPNSAYTLSGTTLSFTGAPPSGTNNVYVVHQAKSVGTIDVPTGGVAAGSLATSVLTGQTDIGAAIADADLFLVDDGAGGTLRKTAASRIKTYIGDNSPMFRVFRSTDQSVGNGSYTKIQYNSENYDTDSAFDSSSNYRFTAPSAGKYYFLAQLQYTSTSDGGQLRGQFYVNGSAFHSSLRMHHTSPNTSDNFMVMADVLSLSASDYVEVYGYQGESGSRNFESYKNYFLGYKLIGT